MPIDQAVKDRAYKIDPPCWKSYSGKDKQYKQRMDSRRTASLTQARKEIAELDRKIERTWRSLARHVHPEVPAEQPDAPWLSPPLVTPPFKLMFPKIGVAHMTPLHILIGIHYASRPAPYAESEPEHRYSKAVRAYTEDLVRAGLLTPREPDTDDVPEHVRNTAAYAATDGLRMWVDALTDVPLPKLREAWTHPALPPRAV